jgi:AraC-like DNA-binding protein
MQRVTAHLAPMPRLLPSALPVQHIGHVRKLGTDQIRKAFTTMNVSFVLAGAGGYRSPAGRQELRAPAAFLQRPGVPVDYGPDADGWTELYLIFAADREATLCAAGLIDPETPCWPVTSPRFSEAVRELLDLLQSRPQRGHADRVDAAVHRLLLESRLGGRAAEGTGSDAVVRRLRHRLEQAPPAVCDLAALAGEAGLSPTHFRRLWKAQVGAAPLRYLANLRLRQACRDLVETGRTIAAIAADLGFTDQLYFARRFRAGTGMSPTAYRERYRQLSG